MTFESDAFISYAHLDNQELIEGQKGWVANFHRALEIRAGQLMGKQPRIWRDPELRGNDMFADTLTERLRRVAALVSVISPRYVKSDWTLRELREFWKAASEAGGVTICDKARIFKILKTPIEPETYPLELQALLGYEFFTVDPHTGKARELDMVFGPEAQRDFWMKVDDVAHDLCGLLQLLECYQEGDAKTAASAKKEPVYLAETTFDLRKDYEAIKRDLQQHGHTVLPARPLPVVTPELRTMVREELARCRLSVHLVGRNYGVVPEGGAESLAEIQNELAAERDAQGDFARLVWIAPGLQVEDERQRRFLDRVRTSLLIHKGADLLETSLEDLRTLIQERLKQAAKPPRKPADPASAGAGVTSLYLIYDQRDRESARAWEDFLFEQSLEVMTPAFEGDEAEIRELHEENLRACDAALIHYGAGNECWLRRKLREVRKSVGQGRTTPLRAVGISVAPPMTPMKERFRTHEALVIPQWEGLAPDPMRAFIAQASGAGG